MALAATVPLVGRSSEIEQLSSALERPDAADRYVLVVGKLGIGKSALLSAVSDRAQHAGALVVSLRGVEAERDLAFGGLYGLWSSLASHLPHLPAAQQEAGQIVLGLAAGAPPAVAPVGLASLGLLSRAAARQDVVVVVDNLGWLDRHSQAVLAFLIRRLTDQRVALIAAARSGYYGVLADLGAVLELGPLAPGDDELIVRRSHPTMNTRTTDYVLAQARGNPLALIELPKALPLTFRVPAAEIAPDLPLSSRLTRAFGGGLGSLPPATRAAVLAAALYTGPEAAPVLTAASTLFGAPVTVVDLEPAAAAGLIEVTGQLLEFSHPLVRSAVITEETASRRRAAHAALGAALGNDPLACAWHRASAAVAPDDHVADELEVAAPLAWSRGSSAYAVRCLERSAELTGDPGGRGRRYVTAVARGLGIGDAESSAELVARAAELPLSRRDQVALDWARVVLDEAGFGDPQRVRRLAGLATEAVALGDRGLALDLLLAAAIRCWWSDPGIETCRAVFEGVVALPEYRDDPRQLAVLAVTAPIDAAPVLAGRLTQFDTAGTGDAQSWWALGLAAHALGDCPRAGHFLDRAETELRRQGAVGGLVPVLLTQAAGRLVTGDWPRAEAALTEARRFGEQTGQPVRDTALLVCRAHSAALRGHLSEALELAGRAELFAARRPVTALLAAVRLVKGCAWAGVGRYSEAYVEFRSLFAVQQPGGRVWPLSSALMFLAEAAAHSGHRAEALEVIDRWARLAASSPAPDLLVHLSYAEAVLADDAAAEQRYEEALSRDLHEWPFVRAMLQAAFGAWLRRQRRIVESRRLTRSALLTFDLIGARGWAARARSELAAAGERLGTSATSIEGVLSPQQLEIAHLAARGLSNREIAERLFLSPRTVSSHLYRIFPKLGVTSRIQLVHRVHGPTWARDTGDRDGDRHAVPEAGLGRRPRRGAR